MAVIELNTKKKVHIENDSKKVSCYYTPETLREAISRSEEDFRMGRFHTIEEVRTKFPKL